MISFSSLLAMETIKHMRQAGRFRRDYDYVESSHPNPELWHQPAACIGCVIVTPISWIVICKAYLTTIEIDSYDCANRRRLPLLTDHTT